MLVVWWLMFCNLDISYHCKVYLIFYRTPPPVIVVLGGTFIGSQGISNPILYFEPMYSKIVKSSRVAKVWSLICMMLLFCCYDEHDTNQYTQLMVVEHRTWPCTESNKSNIFG